MSRRRQPESSVDRGRRRLLIGSGVLGAAATVSPGLLDELDGPRSWLKTAVTWGRSRDYREAAPGVIQSMVAFLLRIGGLSAYNEFAVFNPADNAIVQRPWAGC